MMREMSVRRMVGMCGLAVMGLMAPASLAQVAPPPAEAPAKTPEYTPPPADSPTPKVVPKGEPPKKVNLDPNKDKQQVMVRDGLRKGDIKLPDGFDENLLVQRGPDGKVIKPERPLPWLAFEKNPLISDKQREDLKPILEKRQLMHEVGVVNNLDLIMKVDAGEFERLDPRDRRQLAWAERTQRQLRSAGMMSEWLYVQGHISDVQAAGCQVLGDAYGKAKLEDCRKESGEDKTAMSTAITRELFTERVDEPLYVYRRLLERAAGVIDEIVTATEMSPEIRASLEPEIAAVRAASTDEQKRVTMTALLNKMPDWVMQHQMMDAAISKRFTDRATKLPDGRAMMTVMPYQVEIQKRRDQKAKGEEVQLQKEPLRPTK